MSGVIASREDGSRTAEPGCPLCGRSPNLPWALARDVEYHVTDEVFEILRCPHCEILFVHPMLYDSLELIYPPNYYSFSGDRASLIRNLKARLDVRLFRSALKQIPGDHLAALDVGGGTGWLLDLVRRADPRVTQTQVVDLDAKAGVIARSRGHEYFQGRFEEFEAARPFDLILMLNLIEHVRDPLAVLSHARRMLSPHGLILIQTPNFDSLDARWFRNKNWGGYHCPRHFILFNAESFRRIAAESGLRIERFQYTQGGSFWSISILAWLARRGWTRINAQRPVFQHPLYAPLGAALAVFDQAGIMCGAPASQMSFWLALASGPVADA